MLLKRLILFFKILIVTGLVIHFTIKDLFHWSSILFYALPLPIICALALFVSFFSKKLLRGVFLAIALVCSIIWINRSYQYHEIENTSSGLEIVFWNGRRSKRFQDAFSENGGIPDVLVMVEYDDEKVNKAKDQYPDYFFYLSEKEIGIFSKTPINIINELKHKDNSILIHFETNGLNFYAVDIAARLFKFRKEALQFIASNIHNKEKTIILGDFNTPIESLHFTFFKENFVNVFNEKGNGFRETWLWNIPLLMLDHIWVSKDLKTLKTEKINTFKSDHTIIKTTVK